MKNGLLPVSVDAALHARLVADRAANASMELTLDLPTQRLVLPSGEAASFEIDPFAKKCLQEGLDELGYLLTFEPEITRYESQQH